MSKETGCGKIDIIFCANKTKSCVKTYEPNANANAHANSIATCKSPNINKPQIVKSTNTLWGSIQKRYWLYRVLREICPGDFCASYSSQHPYRELDMGGLHLQMLSKGRSKYGHQCQPIRLWHCPTCSFSQRHLFASNTTAFRRMPLHSKSMEPHAIGTASKASHSTPKPPPRTLSSPTN